MSGPGFWEERLRKLARALPAEARLPVEREAGPLADFLQRLWQANAQVNLVSRRTTPEELLGRHLLDSLRGLAYLPRSSPPGGEVRRKLLDIGSGGGFPAIPLLLVRRDIEGVLVESVAKKQRFLTEVAGALGLTVRVAGTRFPAPSMSDLAPFDILTSRAVADAGTLLRQAAAWLSPGAVALFWTSERLVPEILRASGRETRPRVHSAVFHGDPEAESRGIAVIECST